MGKSNPTSLTGKLSAIQSELKAPKGQRNSFGNYNYRSCEDILEAVKPLLAKHNLSLTLADTIEVAYDRVYVKATATLTDGEQVVETTAFAREEENKKGMDGAQVTGAASSYARKYALNGLFCIDDTKDSDATNDHGKAAKTTAKKTVSRKAPAAKVEVEDIMGKAVAYIKAERNDKQKAFDAIISKYGEQLTPKQQEGLAKFVR